MTAKELERYVTAITDRLDEVNAFFIRKVAEQIKKIGELGQANVNRLVNMIEYGMDVGQIDTLLQEATELNAQETQEIYQKALDDVYTDRRFEKMLEADKAEGGKKVRYATERLTYHANLVARQTREKMQNLANTTAVSEQYREMMDRAVLAVSTGQTDYNSATRGLIRELGYNGLQVHYESGHRRRLDTAVRQNVVDAVHQISQQGYIIMGETMGCDAYEISAHANSALDHEPVQGRVFPKAEFEKMQAGQDFWDVEGKHYEGFLRPIAEWNCGHIAMPFFTAYSSRKWSDEQLAEWAKANAEGCEIDGKHYTNYEVTQLMRKLETRVRRWKDAANAARIAENMEERQYCQRKINALAQQYERVAELSGFRTRKARMSVEGFKMVKV